MSGGQGPRNPAGAHAEEVQEENLKKKFPKPLDKLSKVWYTKNVKRVATFAESPRREKKGRTL